MIMMKKAQNRNWQKIILHRTSQQVEKRWARLNIGTSSVRRVKSTMVLVFISGLLGVLISTGRMLRGKYATARSAGDYLAGMNGATGKIKGKYISLEIYMRMAGGCMLCSMVSILLKHLIMGKSLMLVARLFQDLIMACIKQFLKIG